MRHEYCMTWEKCKLEYQIVPNILSVFKKGYCRKEGLDRANYLVGVDLVIRGVTEMLLKQENVNTCFTHLNVINYIIWTSQYSQPLVRGHNWRSQVRGQSDITSQS